MLGVTSATRKENTGEAPERAPGIKGRVNPWGSPDAAVIEMVLKVGRGRPTGRDKHTRAHEWAKCTGEGACVSGSPRHKTWHWRVGRLESDTEGREECR